MVASPVILKPDGTIEKLRALNLGSTDSESSIKESFLDDLLFAYPDILPVRELDSAYIELVPLCKQMETGTGPADLVFATSSGRLVIVENKLWRNPEARRKVVAQLLDYAASISKWSYEDLQREVSKRTGRKGNSVFELVCERYPTVQEADFVDAMSQSLRLGRFLLLVCGDGIREGTANIAEFLHRFTSLDFSFGIVEIGISEASDGARFILPKTICRTETITRQVFQIDGEVVRRSDNEVDGAVTDEDMSDYQSKYLDFWSEFSSHVEYDDPAQAAPNPARKSFVTLRMPHPTAWITLFFSTRSSEMGVFLAFNRGSMADTLWEALCVEKSAIAAELPVGSDWYDDDGRHFIKISRPLLDVEMPDQREEAKQWLGDISNAFVNALRHRLGDAIEAINRT